MKLNFIRKVLLSITLISMMLLSNAQKVVTVSNINLRTKPNKECTILTQIPKGTIITLRNCSTIWCETSYNGYEGFIHKDFVKTVQENITSSHNTKTGNTQNTSSVKYYRNTNGEKVQSPTKYDSPPQGASALCNDGTYSFSRSRRGTCSHHGGVKIWLK